MEAESQKNVAASIEEGVRERRNGLSEEVGSCLERSKGARMTRVEIPLNAPNMVLLLTGARGCQGDWSPQNLRLAPGSSGTPISPWQCGHG